MSTDGGNPIHHHYELKAGGVRCGGIVIVLWCCGVVLSVVVIMEWVEKKKSSDKFGQTKSVVFARTSAPQTQKTNRSS